MCTGYQVSGPVVPYHTLPDEPMQQEIQSVADPILQGKLSTIKCVAYYVIFLYSIKRSN